MRKILIYMVLISSISFVTRSCIQSTESVYGNNIHRFVQEIEGKYTSAEILPNNDTFYIILNKDLSFLEHNYWGNIYGRWSIVTSQDVLEKRGLMMWTDSVCSNYFFHKDAGVQDEAAMYYYNGIKRNEKNVVRLRDRDGRYLYIFDAYFYDSCQEKIIEYHMNEELIDSIEIPPNTQKITIIGPYMINSHCICTSYCQDSGDVCFVLMPNNDNFCRQRIVSPEIITFETKNGEIKMRKMK